MALLLLALALASAGGARADTGAYVFRLNRTDLGCARSRQQALPGRAGGGEGLTEAGWPGATAHRQCPGLSPAAHACPAGCGPSPPPPRWATEIALGTPPQRISAMIDTGSGLVWLPARGCGAACSQGLPPGAGLDATASSTFAAVPCDAPACGTDYCEACSCGEGSAPGGCTFANAYMEGAKSFGDFVQDRLALPAWTAGPRAPTQPANATLAFGLQQGATGALLQQSIPALIGGWRATASEPGPACQAHLCSCTAAQQPKHCHHAAPLAR